jgi:hypothetical protein
MKIALCLYGQARTFEFCAPSVKKLIMDVYSPDVFICSDTQGDKLKELYRPVSMEIISDSEVDSKLDKRGYPEWASFPGWPQYHILISREMNYRYKEWRCGEMLKTYGPYDVVVVTRPDIKFLHIDPITMPEENYLYLPKIDAHQWPADENGLFWHVGYSAHTWWSSYSTAQKLLDSYHWCDDAFKALGCWSGELMLRWYCDQNNIRIKQTNVTQMIIKGDKNHPRSDSFEFGEPLSLTHYPEYCDPPLPTKYRVPVALPTPGGIFIGGHPSKEASRAEGAPW